MCKSKHSCRDKEIFSSKSRIFAYAEKIEKEGFCMKRKICYSVLLLLTAVCAAYVISAWRMVGKHRDKIWLGQCNSVERLLQTQSVYPNFQMDVLICQDSTLAVMQGEDSVSAIPIDPFFEFLAKHPQSHLWMDMKNLSGENLSLFKKSLLINHNLVRPNAKQKILVSALGRYQIQLFSQHF